MIDKLKRAAQATQFLRFPSVVIGGICFLSATYIFLTSRSHETDFLLIPSLAGLLWAISTHCFIATFCAVPEATKEKLGFFKKIKYKLKRTWYWVIGLLFLSTSALLILMTFRIFSYWMRSY
ncbi:hypothetical protein [Spartinivicinus poritis]|uniref:Uncharacterized protein n=1 Tax=Spartinivicinus poritis TaxID=2994640 RepID=A0ABT5UB96_9GAMM|nr:hypothetical protein [Spartinivicinus sp. A2-2]MDE1463455.1 hypothetical protein [Spartinivicinus sp. A2-2]